MLYNITYVMFSYVPTSGDLKSGDSLFCTTTPPLPPNAECQQPQHPYPAPRQQIAFGHYMTSYMKYIESKCAFIIVMTN